MRCQFYLLSEVDDILVVCRCSQRNFLFTFMSKFFFQIFVAKGDTCHFFERYNSL